MKKPDDLGIRIMQVVQDHLAESYATAAAAVERAFAAATSVPARALRPSQPRKPGRRRAPEEMVALSQRLYEVVCAKPGEFMVVLAADVGATPRELNRPMSHLKRAGKVRCVGQRNLTRYFPLVSEAAKGSA